MDDALAKLARKQWGVFSRSQVIEAGATRSLIHRRLRQKAWIEVIHGVFRFPGGHESWHQKVSAATLALTPHGMASHRTAAFLWGLEGLGGAPAMIEVIAPFNVGRHVSLAKVHHTRVLPKAAEQRAGIATTPLARTLVDLADVRTEKQLFITFDSARRKFSNVVAELEKELKDHGAGRRHRDRLLALIARAKVEPATESPLEADTAFELDGSGFPRPKRQHRIYDLNGNFIARVDFAWLNHHVIVQCDSRQWHMNPEAFEKDLRQRRQLESNGWRLIHVTSLMLKTKDWLVDLGRLLARQSSLALNAPD